MTRWEWKEKMPLIQAFVEGKRVQFYSGEFGWKDAYNVSFGDPVNDYRIAPEPKLRPWTAEEVPLGAVFQNFERDKGDGPVWLSVEKDRVLGVQLGNAAGRVSFESLAKSFQHSTDGGKTWKPCGVEEGEK